MTLKLVRKGIPFFLPLFILLSIPYLMLSGASEPSEIEALALVEVVVEGFKEPTGVVIDHSGMIFVSDRKAGAGTGPCGAARCGPMIRGMLGEEVETCIDCGWSILKGPPPLTCSRCGATQ